MTEPAIPEEILGPPEGPPPALPPETALLELPFHGLRWEDFEKLILRLADLEAQAEETRRYGTPGQAQAGIDVYSRLRDGGGYCVYQCKRYETLFPGDIREAVTRFLDGPWAARAGRLVLCISQSCVAVDRAEVIEEQAALLRARRPAVALEVWDAERLSIKLKDYPDLVRLFFGADALRRFNPGHHEAEVAASIDTAVERLVSASLPAPRIVDLSWGPRQLRDAYHELSAEGLLQMLAILGESPSGPTIAGVIANPPSGLQSAGQAEWRVLALEAQRTGEWSAAARAWDEVAVRIDGDDARVRALGNGAAAAGVAGESELQAAFQHRARAIDASHPRVILMELDASMAPAEQLALLDGVRSDDAAVESLIEGHRVLAYLMLTDLDSAEKSLEAARILAPESASIGMLRVNVAVQRGRLDLTHHRPLHGAELRDAIASADVTRRRLREERRFGEAVRVLMLGADAHVLLEERAYAARLLATASPEELAEPDAPEVLGDAALRALDSRLALRLTEDAATSEAIERIRAAAYLDVGNADQKDEAVATLDRLVAGAGAESDEAAFLRLHAALASPHIPWSEDAHDHLVRAGHIREATILQASHIARHGRDVGAAIALLETHGDEPWALVWRLRLALTHAQSDGALEDAAASVMASGPSQPLRVECGRAFARAKNFARAREVLVSVARDPGAPTETRAEAYHYLVRIAGVEEDEWVRAGEYLSEWIDLAPGDARASQWAPTVANRKRRS